MSDQASELKEFARELFKNLVQDAGPQEWDWQSLANKAFDAALGFELIASQRLNPQTATPAASSQIDQSQAQSMAASPPITPMSAPVAAAATT